MPVVRYKLGGAAVTVSDEAVERYQSKGWILDQKPKPKPSRRKPVDVDDD